MPEPKTNDLMEKIVSLCKRRGFIFQSSEIYGGINGFWDYGPLGAELKRNVKDCWWRSMVHQRDDIVGLEATIIMHPQIWKASGHVDTFADPMCDCIACKKRFRADQITELLADSAAYRALTEIFESHKEEITKSFVPEKLINALREWVARIGRKAFPNIAAVVERREALSYADWPNFNLDSSSGLVPLSPDALWSYMATARQSLSRRIDWVIGCPSCGGQLTPPRPFNLMFKTHYGPVESDENIAYLRPETAQAIFVQFKNVLETSRQKVPFGIAQVGKAFRNEVTPRNYTFRSREFEQMELEFFIRPDEAVQALAGSVAKVSDNPVSGDPQLNWGWEVWHKYWVEQRIRFYESIGLPRSAFEEYWQKPEELAHYARATVDILYKFPFGTQELEGIAARGDFDLMQHEKYSGKPMTVFDEDVRAAWGKLDQETKNKLESEFARSKGEALKKKGIADPDATIQAEREAKAFFDKLAKGQFIPHVIEPSAGVDRLILALICHAYHEAMIPDAKGNPELRVLLRFHPRIAPVKVGVFPLLKNRPELVSKAREVRDLLRPHMTVAYDDSGAIGRRYARQDEAGTPFGVTVDFDTLGERPELKETVTLRDRDTTEQVRIKIDELLPSLLEKIR